MSKVEDLAAVPAESRTNAIDLAFSEQEMVLVSAEAARRGVSVEEYVLWAALTAAESTIAGGPMSGGSA